MNAKQAREKAKALDNVKTSLQLQEVRQQIKRAVESAEFETIYYGKLNQQAMNALIADGFKVVFESNYRDSFYRISW